MFSSKALTILAMGGLALVGCTQEPENATTTTTKTETKQVGSTTESTTQTKVDTASGDTKSLTKTYVGTVTAFTPGKSIEVMTGNKDTHSVELDGAKAVVLIDPATAVGSKIQLVEETGENGFHRITVTIAPAA